MSVKVGRPKRQFSAEEVQLIEEYALKNCNTETIANALEIPVNTLKRHFGRLLKQKRAEHRVNLRTNQAKLAKSNPAMAIFLGKNELNQVDKQIIDTPDSEQHKQFSPKEVETLKKAAIELTSVP